jgi:hypothetical protein
MRANATESVIPLRGIKLLQFQFSICRRELRVVEQAKKSYRTPEQFVEKHLSLGLIARAMSGAPSSEWTSTPHPSYSANAARADDSSA